MQFLRQAYTYLAFLAFFGSVSTMANELTNVEKNAAVCFSCHGDKGNSENPQVPNLAAQQSVYTVNQLKAFKAGTRSNAIMQAQTAKMSDEDINNYGAYFAVQQPAKVNVDAILLIQQGKEKAVICLGCHGASAEGSGQNPKLAGQHPDYLEQQLKAFKNGKRQNGAMQAISNNLSDEEIKKLAAFLGSL